MKTILFPLITLALILTSCGDRTNKEYKKGSRVLADYVETPLNKAKDMSETAAARNKKLSEQLDLDTKDTE